MANMWGQTEQLGQTTYPKGVGGFGQYVGSYANQDEGLAALETLLGYKPQQGRVAGTHTWPTATTQTQAVSPSTVSLGVGATPSTPSYTFGSYSSPGMQDYTQAGVGYRYGRPPVLTGGGASSSTGDSSSSGTTVPTMFAYNPTGDRLYGTTPGGLLPGQTVPQMVDPKTGKPYTGGYQSWMGYGVQV